MTIIPFSLCLFTTHSAIPCCEKQPCITIFLRALLLYPLMSIFTFAYHCFSAWGSPLSIFASGYVNYFVSRSVYILSVALFSGLGGSTDCTLIYPALVKPLLVELLSFCTIILFACTFTLKIPLSISIAFFFTFIHPYLLLILQ